MPVFFSLPRNEGDGAPKGACSGFRRNGPDYAGRPGSAGSDASETDASASFDAPSRYLSAFAFLGRRTDAGPSVPRMVSTGGRSGAWLCRPHPRVPHPAPSLRHLAWTPLGGRDDLANTTSVEQIKNNFAD